MSKHSIVVANTVENLLEVIDQLAKSGSGDAQIIEIVKRFIANNGRDMKINHLEEIAKHLRVAVKKYDQKFHAEIILDFVQRAPINAQDLRFICLLSERVLNPQMKKEIYEGFVRNPVTNLLQMRFALSKDKTHATPRLMVVYFERLAREGMDAVTTVKTAIEEFSNDTRFLPLIMRGFLIMEKNLSVKELAEILKKIPNIVTRIKCIEYFLRQDPRRIELLPQLHAAVFNYEMIRAYSMIAILREIKPLLERRGVFRDNAVTFGEMFKGIQSIEHAHQIVNVLLDEGFLREPHYPLDKLKVVRGYLESKFPNVKSLGIKLSEIADKKVFKFCNVEFGTYGEEIKDYTIGDLIFCKMVLCKRAGLPDVRMQEFVQKLLSYDKALQKKVQDLVVSEKARIIAPAEAVVIDAISPGKMRGYQRVGIIAAHLQQRLKKVPKFSPSEMEGADIKFADVDIHSSFTKEEVSQQFRELMAAPDPDPKALVRFFDNFYEHKEVSEIDEEGNVTKRNVGYLSRTISEDNIKVLHQLFCQQREAFFYLFCTQEEGLKDFISKVNLSITLNDGCIANIGNVVSSIVNAYLFETAPDQMLYKVYTQMVQDGNRFDSALDHSKEYNFFNNGANECLINPQGLVFALKEAISKDIRDLYYSGIYRVTHQDDPAFIERYNKMDKKQQLKLATNWINIMSEGDGDFFEDIDNTMVGEVIATNVGQVFDSKDLESFGNRAVALLQQIKDRKEKTDIQEKKQQTQDHISAFIAKANALRPSPSTSPETGDDEWSVEPLDASVGKGVALNG